MFHNQIKFLYPLGRGRRGEREEITKPTGPLKDLGTLASIVNDQEVLFTSKRHTKSSAMHGCKTRHISLFHVFVSILHLNSPVFATEAMRRMYVT